METYIPVSYTHLECLQDDACYYACMTFGTKTYPVVLFSALSYAEKIRRNTQISGIYYCEIRRQEGRDKEAGLYDVSALFTLNALVDLVAGMDCEDKDKMIRTLSLIHISTPTPEPSR